MFAEVKSSAFDMFIVTVSFLALFTMLLILEAGAVSVGVGVAVGVGVFGG